MKEILAVSLLLIPNTRKILHRINNGWQRRPVNASVTAKQASKMLLLVRSRGVVFTAFITSTLSRTAQGKEMVLMMIMIMEPANDGTSLSPSLLVMFVVFVKVAKEKFTISNWNLNASQVCL